MIDLKHKYALLENGSIEKLYYSDGEMRMAYRGEDGKYYLDHDVWGRFLGCRCIAYRHDEILATSDDANKLLAIYGSMVTEDEDTASQNGQAGLVPTEEEV